ncbi:MAG: RNA polymerase subunit sigma [Bacteroidetes bacterium MedPE-SWsnd-G2]|nr:MAG: RNA polymerase subunit sigma [Bacteroidetes bacterium MedPE-SWsnd-G2]
MTLTTENIDNVLELCKSGNQQAQLEIYNRYYKAMYNTSFRIVKDSYIAEDIMQESFLTAFSKLSSLKINSTFSAWLKRIVINNSISYYNKHQKTINVPLDDVIYKVEDHQGIVEDYDATSIKARSIIEMLNGLKENYKMGLTLHLIEGYDYEEISEIMSISYANCRTLISRAKDSLRKKISTQNEFKNSAL